MRTRDWDWAEPAGHTASTVIVDHGRWTPPPLVITFAFVALSRVTVLLFRR